MANGKLATLPLRVALAATVLAPLCIAAPAAAVVEFKGPIRWYGWDDGIKSAASQHKPLLLLLHTDSCPKCTLLGHVFRDNKDVHKLAKQFVMVQVNGGTAPMAVVQRFARFGSYYPRVVFLRDDATPMAEITSANSSFPYYFQPSRPEVLVDAMKRAAESSKGAKKGKG
jgi:hypothetical protein